MDLFELVKSKRSDILNLAGKYGANNVRIFGSVARGTSDDQSDIDFLKNSTIITNLNNRFRTI
jgi:predicted nucleotidyltransferase